MSTAAPSPALPRKRKPELGRTRGLAMAGWPVLVGVAAFVLGFLILAAAAYFHWQAHKLVESAAEDTPRQIPANLNKDSSGPEAFAAQLPLFATHLDDVGLLFKLAKEQGVSIGAITYRTEVIASLSVVVRLAELRVDEDYPKLKAFIAELLRRMPHLYLEEIRVEQGVASSKVQATLKLSFAYQSGKGSAR